MTGRERISKFIPMAAGRPQIRAGFWLGTSISCHMGFSIGQFATWQLASLRARGERMPKQKPQSFCYLVLKVTFHHFVPCFIQRGEALGPALFQGEKVTQRYEY